MRPEPPRPVRRIRRRRRIRPLRLALVILIVFGILGYLGMRVFGGLTGQGPGEVIGDMFRKPFGGKSEVRILVLGVDDKIEQGRSDSIILANINLDAKEIRAMSVPRDTRVQIPGRSGHEKINASFTHGGAELTKQTVEQLLGVPIDGYIKTNIAGFKGIVDALGGVDLYVEKRMRYRDHAQNLNINLHKGQQHLDGEKAMEYVRFRHDTFGDLTRMQRQQKFLKAVASRLMEPGSWPRIPGIVSRSQEFVETKISPKDLLTLAKFGRDLKPENIRMETLPGAPQTIHGVSYFLCDDVRKDQLVRELYFTPTTQMASGPPPPVEILNGNGTVGIASQASQMLKEKGYKIVDTRNADNFSYQCSQIIAAEDKSEGARQISRVLGCGTVVVSGEAGSDSPVTVILGKDFHPQGF